MNGRKIGNERMVGSDSAQVIRSARAIRPHASTTDPDAKLYRKGNGQSSRMTAAAYNLVRLPKLMAAA